MSAQRGQASITDAFFILLIVSVLAITMASVSFTYGRDVERALLSFYSEDYISSALRVLLESSIPRFVDENLLTADEVDDLLTKMKEDYANTGTFAEDTKILIKRTIDTILSPRAASYDYMLYFWTPKDYPPDPKGMPHGNESDRFIFVYLKISDVGEGNNVERKEYFCEPQIPLKEATNMVLERAPEAAKTRSITTLFTRFVQSSGEIEQKDVVVFTGLIIWHTVGILPGKGSESILTESNLNCKLIS